MPEINLHNKIALVCGAAGGGIGSAVARALAEAGATLAVLDQTATQGDQTREAMRTLGVNVETFAAELADPEQSARVIESVWQKMGAIDILVNVAGGTKAHQWGPFDSSRDADMHDVFALNFDYVFRLCADLGRLMITRGAGGSIVNVASVSGMRSAPLHAAYGAAKAALMSLTQTMAVEWGPYNIRVNAVAPGSVRSPRVSAYGSGPSHFDQASDGRRSVDTSEIANGVLFLSSDLASGISGQILAIDAGLSCGNPVGTLMEIKALMPKP